MDLFSIPVSDSDKRNRNVCEREQLYWEFNYINLYLHFTVFLLEIFNYEADAAHLGQFES